ncbi:MAG: hypothetical protein E5Y00_04770 [Mesorhizobium sp.]|uniref:hypothetical protein n=1 Tax=Mesorhizobium sp. TaxID=1871066 RepID=UPI00121D2C99|nr:hypothetical protein [Mesorhizobium sp.]TIN82734.1 MAG: hypothetical protein E5X97_28930 [Mesorhizobium sp.]TIO88595.1 MAG: hypothetical protein E5Y00_04770 [Mesorhizobium sp.]
MSEQPEFVVSKVPLDTPDTYFETVMEPDEAIEYAAQLVNDALRAKRMRETNQWLAKHQKK